MVKWKFGADGNSVVVAIACLGLLGLSFFIPSTGVWVVDTGLRYLQVVNIVDRHHFGGFWLDYPLQKWDPAFEFVPFGLIQTFVHEGRLYAQYPPWFCYVSAPFYAVWGEFGLRLLPLASAIGLLFGVGALARLCGFRRYSLAAALVLLGSPILPYAYIFWDILPALFFGVWGLVLALQSERSQSVRLAAGAGVMWWGAFFMREEYLLWAAACLLPMLGRRSSRHYAFVAGLVFAAGALTLMAVNNVLVGVPLFFQASTGSGKAWEYTWSFASRGWVAYRYLAFVQGTPLADAALFLALGAVTFLPRAANDRQRFLLLAVSLHAAIIVRFFAWDFTKPLVTQYLVNSFAAATPLAFAGLVAWHTSCPGARNHERIALCTATIIALLFLFFTLALSVPSSAVGLNFGPRLLLPIYPALLLGGLDVLSQAASCIGGHVRRWFLVLSAASLALGFGDSVVYLARLALQYRQMSRLESFLDNLAPQLPIVTEQSWFATMFPTLFYKRTILPAWDGEKVPSVYNLVTRLSPKGFLYVAKQQRRPKDNDSQSKLIPVEIPPHLRPVDSAFSLYLYKVTP